MTCVARRYGCAALAGAAAVMSRHASFGDYHSLREGPDTHSGGRHRRPLWRAGAWLPGSRAATSCQEQRAAGRAVEKVLAPEPSFEDLQKQLFALPVAERRAALSLLGLALGDAAGLPFELRRGKGARAQYHKLPSEEQREERAKQLVQQRAKRKGQTLYVRTYSDDTTCCDLKMEAAAQADVLKSEVDEAGLQRFVLQQYLKWAHGAKVKERIGYHGELFQGTGAFTRDFLVPYCYGRKNEVARVMGHDLGALYQETPEQGPFWPTDKFAQFAADYFRGEYSFPSWGNGAVMSFAPHPVLAARWRREAPSSGQDTSSALRASAKVMSMSHQEPTAILANELLWELLDSVYGGLVGSTDDLRKAVKGLKSLEVEFLDHECIPVEPFREWLEHGDCRVETAEAFLRKLTRSNGRFDLASGPHGVFGSMLHIAADWNDDHSTYLKRANSKEPVLFSQRGLNSVIIAIWAASGSRSPWEVVSRVIYVGGDTDTVGAVAGQVACPLLHPADVVDAFVDFVALGHPEDAALQVANAAARRYFQRAVLFASGDFEELRRHPSLLDPQYPPVTTEVFKKAWMSGIDGL